MAYRQYIGSRYVPIFGRKGEDTYEWDNSAPYEPLTVVMHQGNSFTSIQYVPTGIDINNRRYWAETGNWNAQVESYRQTVLSFDDRITSNTEASTANTEAITAEVTRATAAETANREAITAEVTRATDAETANREAITSEVTRATDAETANREAITSEVTRATDAEKNISNVIGTGFDATDNIAGNIKVKGSGTVCATNYLGSLFHQIADETLGEMHCGSIADCGDYQVIISCPLTSDRMNRGIVEFVSIKDNRKEVYANKTVVLGHANSITYDPNRGKFLVAPLYDTSSGELIYWPVLFEYDVTFTNYSRITTDVTISGISYDHVTGKVYCFGVDDKLYELTNDNNLVFVNECNVRDNDQGLHVQDLAVNSGVWYISNTQGNIATGLIGVDNAKNVFDIAKQGTFQLFNLFGEVDGMDFNANGNLICTSDERVQSAGWIFNIFEIITPETKHPLFYLYHPSNIMTSINITRSSDILRQTLSLLSEFNAANYIRSMIGDVVRFTLTEDYNAPAETIMLNGFAKAIINLNNHTLTIDQIRFDSCELVISGSGTLTIRRFWAPTCEMARITLQNGVTIIPADSSVNPFLSVAKTGSQLNCGTITNPNNLTFVGNVINSGRVYISGTEILTNNS